MGFFFRIRPLFLLLKYLHQKNGKMKNGINKKEKKVPDGNDYSLFSDADELFKKQIETKIIDGKKYFNVKQKAKE